MVLSTLHALERLADWNIAPAWVEAIISQPDWTTPDPDPELTRSYGAVDEAGGKVMRVVHRPEGADVVVVTAFWDERATRRRR